MRVIVCDTGPLLHLSEIGRLSTLHPLGKIAVPAAVVAEMDSHMPGWSSTLPEWIRIECLNGDSASLAAAWETSGMLHPGEAESIALAGQLHSDWYLTDDAAARVFASSLNIETHGTIGILLSLAAGSFIERAEAELLLDALVRSSSLWVSPRIVLEARSALQTLCPD